MENLKEKFEVVWNTQHKDEIKIKFIVPIGKQKRWWQFWKQDEKRKTIIEIMDRFKEEVNFDENYEAPNWKTSEEIVEYFSKFDTGFNPIEFKKQLKQAIDTIMGNHKMVPISINEVAGCVLCGKKLKYRTEPICRNCTDDID